MHVTRTPSLGRVRAKDELDAASNSTEFFPKLKQIAAKSGIIHSDFGGNLDCRSPNQAVYLDRVFGINDYYDADPLLNRRPIKFSVCFDEGNPYYESRDPFNIYERGTNAWALFLSRNTNFQLVPGGVEQALRHANLFGESRGATDLNFSMVSSIRLTRSNVLRSTQMNVDWARWYAEGAACSDALKGRIEQCRKFDSFSEKLGCKAARDSFIYDEPFMMLPVEFLSKSFISSLEKNQSEMQLFKALSRIPVVILGEAPVSSSVVSEGLMFPVRSSIKGEIAVRRLNVRVVACPKEHVNELQQLVPELDEQ